MRYAVSNVTRVTAPPPPPAADTLYADHVNRMTGASVFRAMDFPSATPVNNYRFSDGIGHDPTPTGGSTGSYVRWAPNDGSFGMGCLELEQMTSGNMNSYLWVPFDNTKATYEFNDSGYNRGPGQAFWMQVQMKTNCGGMASTGGGGRKEFSVSLLTNSYTAQELVYQDTNYRGVAQMYQGVGPNSAYEGFEEQTAVLGYSPYDPGIDFNLQPGGDYNTAPAFCSYANPTAPASQGACWNLQNGEWVTYLMYVLPSSDNVANGKVELYGWVDGMTDYVKIMSKDPFLIKYDSGKVFYNAALLWIYETGRTSGAANHKQWYKSLILSTATIPAPMSTPAAVRAQAIGAWTQFGTALSSIDPSPTPAGATGTQGKISAWTGFAVDPRYSDVYLPWAGGHADYSGNEVCKFRAEASSPDWEQLIAPSASGDIVDGASYYDDDRPTSRHHFYGIQFSTAARKVMCFGGAHWRAAGGFHQAVTGYNVDTGVEDGAGDNGDLPVNFRGDVFSSAADTTTGHIYLFCNFEVAKWDHTTGVTTQLSTPSGTRPAGQNGPTAFDSRRNKIWLVGGQYGHNHLYDIAGNSWTAPTLTGAAAAAVAAVTAGAAMEYVGPEDAYFLMPTGSGGTVYRIDASTFVCTTFATTGGGSIPTTANNDGSGANGPYGKFRYVPNIGSIIYVPRHNAQGWRLRVHKT
jgi:hypothetical protein